ncbi:alanine racemase [Rhodococcus sp. MTM3W5.2]|nr:alanine racemase [Rhodococcus sp. MTM3W5.2]
MVHENRSPAMPAAPQACAVIDLDAIRDNVAALLSRARTCEVMAVVKADAYSHGLVPSARAALAGGATRLGVAVLGEAFALRSAGVTAPVLAWLAVPGAPYRRAIDESIDLAVHTIDQLHEISSAVAVSGHIAQIHLKVDTGMGRGGAATDDWPGLVEQARARELDGLVRVAGIWSHLATADEPGEPSIGRQLMVFDEALEVAARGGVRPDVRHIANSAATLYLPESHYDMVRPGIAVYGVDPLPTEHRSPTVALRPAMTLEARLAQVKRVPGAPRFPTATRTRPPTPPPSPWCRSGTRTECPVPRAESGPYMPTDGAARWRGGCAWTSSSSTSATSPPWRGTTSCCSARATTANPQPPTGQRLPGRLPTRSSPGSAAVSRGSTPDRRRWMHRPGSRHRTAPCQRRSDEDSALDRRPCFDFARGCRCSTRTSGPGSGLADAKPVTRHGN